MNKTSSKQIIKCAAALTLWIIFLIWIRSWLGIIAIPFIFDIYITKKIKWTWWKQSESSTVRSIMSWVDAIVFALAAVYLVNIYFFQNYVIPTSSLEKSLLVGDYLFVSKMSYGPRAPMTPLHAPLTAHTIPGLNCKSYIEHPSWDYKRVSGLGKVELGDIVVFNFPAGDTVATKVPAEDIYRIASQTGRDLSNPIPMDSLLPQEKYLANQIYYNKGRKYIDSHPEIFGKVVYRPVDIRENYVKRCCGLPGQTLQIKNRAVYLDGKEMKQPENAEFLHLVRVSRPIPWELAHSLGISREDLQGYYNNTYQMPLTPKAAAELARHKDIVKDVKILDIPAGDGLYPPNKQTGWSVDNYGPLWIPKKGETIKLTIDNLPFYERSIRAYEGNQLRVDGDKIYINGRQTDSYTFKMDYYWMMGDNRHNSADSRFWGFVPEDHIVGKPIFIWLSLDPDCGWLDGKIRWNRLFRKVDNIR